MQEEFPEQSLEYKSTTAEGLSLCERKITSGGIFCDEMREKFILFQDFYKIF